MGIRAYGFVFIWVLVLGLVGLRVEAVTTVTWDGGGLGDSYTSAGNWDPVVVPINQDEMDPDLEPGELPDKYNVIIPQHLKSVSLNYFGNVEVSTFSLTRNWLKLPLEGGNYRVVGPAFIDGGILGDGGNFIADGAGTSLSGGQAILYARQGSLVRVNAPAYSTTELSSSGGVIMFSTGTDFTGVGSVLDLSSLMSIDAGFNGVTASPVVRSIEASDGGKIFLSNVTTLKRPMREQDSVSVSVEGAFSTIDLSSLANLSGPGLGRVDFIARGAELDLPALGAIENVGFFVHDGSAISSNATSLSSTSEFGLSPIMFSNGVDSILDLPELESVSVEVVPFGNAKRIEASNGGEIYLPKVTELVPPLASGERLYVELSGVDSIIDLSGLIATSADGDGSTRFKASDGATLDLPALAVVHDAEFDVSGGAGLNVNTLPDVAYSSAGIGVDATIMASEGAGSMLDLSSLVSVSAAFDDLSLPDVHVHMIRASDGGMIDLQNVTDLTPPVGSKDRLDVEVAGVGSTIDLSGLTSTSAVGAGSTRFSVSDGATLDLPALTGVHDTEFSVSGGSRLNVNTIPGVAYSSAGIGLNTTIMLSGDAGSVLDLSSLVSVSAAFDDLSSATSSAHTIFASFGGAVLMPNVTELIPPVGSGDRLEVQMLFGTETTIDLSGLTTTSAAGAGTTRFLLIGGVELDLPALVNVNDTEFFVSSGAALNVNVSTGATFSSIGISRDTTIMSSDGVGSILDLSSFVSIDSGFNDLSTLSGYQAIKASNGGVIHLPNVATLHHPVQAEDRLEVSVTNATSMIDLSNLSNLSGPGMGKIDFIASIGAILDLPALGAINNVGFSASGGALLTASATSITSTSGMGTIMESGGTGSVIDLPSLESVMVEHTQQIVAYFGGAIKLPNVTVLTPPVASGDRLDVVMFGAGSTIDLSGLTTTSAAGEGLTWFSISGGVTLDLPALVDIHDAEFHVMGGARINVNVGTGARYSSAGISHDTKIMSSDHAGSVLDLSALDFFDARFNDGSGSVTTQTISATDGGQIDLSGVGTIRGPVRLEDRLEFVAAGDGSRIDLGSMTMATNVHFDVGAGSELHFGNVFGGSITTLLGGSGSLKNAGLVTVDAGGIFRIGSGVEVVQTGEIEVIDGVLWFETPVANEGDVKVTLGEQVRFLSELSGSGSFSGVGDHLFYGVVRPGTGGIGRIPVVGDVFFEDTTRLVIQMRAGDPVDGVVAGVDFDQVTVSAGVRLDGVLDVAFLGEDLPALGTLYPVMVFGGRGESEFDSASGLLLDTGLALALVLGDTDVTLRMSVPGDMNFDDAVTVGDLSAFALNFGASVGAGDYGAGDFNGDGMVTVADLSLLALNFGFDAGDPSSVGLGLSVDEAAGMVGIDLSLVPEPGVLGVVVGGLAGVMGRRRRAGARLA